VVPHAEIEIIEHQIQEETRRLEEMIFPMVENFVAEEWAKPIENRMQSLVDIAFLMFLIVDKLNGFHIDELKSLQDECAPNIIPVCGKGCSWCCYENTNVSVLDLLAAWSHAINTLDPAVVDGIAARASEVATRYRAMGEDLAAVQRDPCPFLQDKECLVYEARPRACRSYFSAELDSCMAEYDAGNDAARVTVRQSVKFHLIGGAVIEALRQSFGLRGVSFEPYRLTEALDILMSRGPEAIALWLQGEDVFAPSSDAARNQRLLVTAGKRMAESLHPLPMAKS
jgi:Fe-S-cluster containining protein